MSRAVLIAPPRYEKAPDHFLPQNLGLGYLAAVLEKAGHYVTIIDALALGWNHTSDTLFSGIRLRGLPNDRIAPLIPADTDFIGITSSFVSSMPLVRELSAFLKPRFPGAKIVAGGIAVSIDPLTALQEPSVDYAVRGAGEIPLLGLVSGKEPQSIKGVVSRAFDNGRAEMIQDLDAIPFPARHLLPMEKYLRRAGRGRRDLRTVSVLTSRGCPYDCNFCSIHHIYGHQWRGRSAANVLAEIEGLIETYGVQHVEFEDDNLTLDGKRAQDMFEGLARLPRKITWSTPNGTRVDTLNRDLLRLMKRSGCTTLFLSIESGDPDILKAMNKKLNLAKVEEVVRTCGEFGINTSGIFMVGYPGETKESFERTASYIRKLHAFGLVGVGASIAKAYPGTNLRRFCEKENLLIEPDRYLRGIPVGEYVDIRIPSCDETDILHRLVYVRRNLNPLRFWSDRLGVTAVIKFLMPQWLIDGVKKNVYRFSFSRHD